MECRPEAGISFSFSLARVLSAYVHLFVKYRANAGLLEDFYRAGNW